MLTESYDFNRHGCRLLFGIFFLFSKQFFQWDFSFLLVILVFIRGLGSRLKADYCFEIIVISLWIRFSVWAERESSNFWSIAFVSIESILYFFRP